jgi:DNA end-binding protein Ku
MAARANWKGYLKLSLVSCAVALYPATSTSSRVRFNTLNRATGNRVKQQYIDPATGETVDAEDRVKGYEVGKNAYVFIEDEELDAIKIESTHTIDIESFVPVEQVDKRYLEAPYYIAPDDKVAQEAFAVIRDAMKGKGMVALGRIVLNKRERVMALEPFGKGLLGTTLHYAYEVRDAADYFDDITDVKISGEMLKLAEHIMEGKSGEFEPSEFKDHYETALVEMLQQKQAGFKPPKGKEKPAAPNVVNLMDALRQSIAAGRRTPAAEKAASKAEKPAPKKGKKQVAGQSEMLLPIEGKKTKEVKKPAAKPAAGKQRKAG